MNNILKKAHEIVYERTEEKQRQYGPFEEGMQRAAQILNGMTGLNVDAEIMYKALIALKLSRESYNHKEDNLLDAVAYLSSMNDFLNKTK
jgi:DNA-binding protein H-NS